MIVSRFNLLYLFFVSHFICSENSGPTLSFDKLFYENNYAKAYKHAVRGYYALIKADLSSKNSDTTSMLAFITIAWREALADFYYLRAYKKSHAVLNGEDRDYIIRLHNKIVDAIEAMAVKNRALYSIALVFVECNAILDNLESTSNIEA